MENQNFHLFGKNALQNGYAQYRMVNIQCERLHINTFFFLCSVCISYLIPNRGLFYKRKRVPSLCLSIMKVLECLNKIY